MSDGSNGSNGHGALPFPPSACLGVDLGKERDGRAPKPCLARLENGGWCQKPDGHNHMRDAEGKPVRNARGEIVLNDDPCEGPARPHGPEQSRWHVHRGQKRACGVVTGPASLCGYERGHGGKHEDPR
jgi:hypothetical protein